MVGSGHKSNEIFEHYADHIQREKALNRIADTSERLFGDLITNVADEIEYSVTEEVTEPISQSQLLPAITSQTKGEEDYEQIFQGDSKTKTNPHKKRN